MDKYKKYIDGLNAPSKKERLENLNKLKALVDCGEIKKPKAGRDVNNHIHTTYSFSPYSPTKAVWMAWNAGLVTAGIMDHDSIAGAEEFTKAGEIMELATTIGIECRVDFSKTSLNGRKINNPDQHSVIYMALHGIPHTQIEKVQKFFEPVRKFRNERNRKEVDKINEIISDSGISLDFDNDIIPISMAHDGGGITERHILFALANKLIESIGKGSAVIDFLENKLNISVKPSLKAFLEDENNVNYAYDLLGVMKSELVPKFFIPADLECPDVADVVALGKETGAISAYAYLGDIDDSVTGDKKAEKFEDDYIEELFSILSKIGFDAITYMPSRNTRQQLDKVRELCDKHGLFQISGEDINQPRQSFVCMAMRDSSFDNLYDAAWALIGHERAATIDLENGFFSKKSIIEYPALDERTAHFRDKAIKMEDINGC